VTESQIQSSPERVEFSGENERGAAVRKKNMDKPLFDDARKGIKNDKEFMVFRKNFKPGNTAYMHTT